LTTGRKVADGNRQERVVGGWIAAVALLLASVSVGWAKPMEPALQQQLLGIYDAYNKDVLAGKVTDAVNLRSAEERASAAKEMPTEAARQRFLVMAKTMVPDTVQPLHASINAAGDKASIITLGTKTIPKGVKLPPGAPPPGTVLHSELMLTYVKESDGWKLDDQMFGPDPADVKKCKNEKYESDAAFDGKKTTSMGGPIVRVDYAPDHTLIVIRVVDEETCVFLRENKDALSKRGVEPARLVPYAVLEIQGHPHKTDKQKVLADNVTVHDDE
jgi:hypothetical protein